MYLESEMVKASHVPRIPFYGFNAPRHIMGHIGWVFEARESLQFISLLLTTDMDTELKQTQESR
jgi:hypothetical protein